MKKATIDDMELGNLIFGHSYGMYHIEPRDVYQDAFAEFLFSHGFDGYGHPGNGEWSFENDTFIIRPYYWGEDEHEASLPNFVYKPTGLEIKWYKYPLRDAYSNQNITVDELKRILNNCAESMKK